MALLLALISWPFVALTMTAVYPYDVHYVGTPVVPASELGRWSAAASAVFISALVAGTIGGFVVRRRAVAGGLFTFVLALAVAIPALPLLPWLLGEPVGVACYSAIAPGLASSCQPEITTMHLVNNLWGVPFFWLAPFVEPRSVLALALGVGVWTALLTRSTWLPRLKFLRSNHYM